MEKRKIFCLQKRKNFRFFGFDRILTKAEDIIMAEKRRRDFCIECRKETEYLLQKKEIDEQYRAAEGLVSIDDIEKLMKIYKIGKAPLSLALGFGEVTIPRYLEGQIPSREYSDVVRAALASPVNMKQKLMENRDKLTDAAYRKAMAADEKEVIDLVANTFGMYGGKVLERVTHNVHIAIKRKAQKSLSFGTCLCYTYRNDIGVKCRRRKDWNRYSVGRKRKMEQQRHGNRKKR